MKLQRVQLPQAPFVSCAQISTPPSRAAAHPSTQTYLASEQGNAECIRVLCSHNADVATRAMERGATCIYVVLFPIAPRPCPPATYSLPSPSAAMMTEYHPQAAHNGHAGAIRVLAGEFGGKVDACTSNGASPLCVAAGASAPPCPP